jgi:hypothetical protein
MCNSLLIRIPLRQPLCFVRVDIQRSTPSSPPGLVEVKYNVVPSADRNGRVSSYWLFTVVSGVGADQSVVVLPRVADHRSIPAEPVRFEWKMIPGPLWLIVGRPSFQGLLSAVRFNPPPKEPSS